MPVSQPNIARLLGLALHNAITQRPGRCIRLRGGAPCEECRRACPLGLGLVAGDSLIGDEAADRCTRCGACAAACPTGALALAEESRSDWMRRLTAAAAATPAENRASTALTIACGNASPGNADVRCLLGVDESFVLLAWAKGFGQVTLRRGECAHCGAAGRAVGLGWVDSVISFGQALTPQRLVSLVEERTDNQNSSTAPAPPKDPVQDRRAFLTGLGARARQELAQQQPAGAEVIHASESGAGEPSPSRTVAVAALEALLSAGTNVAEPLAARPGPLATLGPRVANGSCTFCGDCVRFCPVGALRLRDAEGEARLALDPSRCVGCSLCATLCRFGAVDIVERSPDRAARPNSWVLLARGRTSVCERCGELFGVAYPDGADSREPDAAREPPLCPTCQRGAARIKGTY